MILVIAILLINASLILKYSESLRNQPLPAKKWRRRGHLKVYKGGKD